MRWFIAGIVVSLAVLAIRGVRAPADQPGPAGGKEPVVVATWEHRVTNKDGAVTRSTIKLYSNGRINEQGSKNTWKQDGNTLILRWANPKAPGGAWQDSYKISADGKTYTGRNHRGAAVAGKLVRKAAGPAAVAAPRKEPTGKDAEDVREIGVFWGNGKPVHTIALSPDGARLVIVRRLPKADGAPKKEIPLREALVWDVAAEKTQCSCQNPKAIITRASFSADSKTLLTVAQGTSRGFDVPDRKGIRSDGAYQVWDVQTGREFGAFAPENGEFRTVALSPDGKHLATSYYEEVRRTKFKAQEVAVWDVAEHKVKWLLPGVPHTGSVGWGEDLAFSPDGTRLALFMEGSGGPDGRYLPIPGPGGQPKSLKPLRILTLEPGKEEPKMALLEEPVSRVGELIWPTKGKFLILRDERKLDLLDAKTGKNRDGTIELREPPLGMAPPLKPIPGPRPGTQILPPEQAIFETQDVLSADGSRLAAHYILDRLDMRGRENRIAIWDVPSHKALGVVVLPNEPPALFGRHVSRLGEERTALRIALSGNGHRLAVADRTGTVRVYDVTKLAARSVPKPAPLPAAEQAAIRAAYEQTLADARKRLLEQFNEVADKVRKLESPKKAAVIAELMEQRDRFDKHNELPWSSWMIGDMTGYLRRVEQARTEAIVKYGHAKRPDDLVELMDRRVIARWKRGPGNSTVTLYSNGRINSPTAVHVWSLEPVRVDLAQFPDNPFRANLDVLWVGRLTLRWNDAKAPFGAWVDTCTVNFDGLSYQGANQNGTKVSGQLIRDE